MEKVGTGYDPIEGQPLKVSSPALDYQGGKQQGEYTLEDYYALPEGKRMELIDGVFYDMSSAPSYIHQAISAAIFRQLDAYIERKGGSCMPFYAPCDVQLDRDDRTMVQPDVMIVCNRDLISRQVLFGAPDFVVEILSPSTRWKDMHIKLHKYTKAGVREYWMVDPDSQTVTVYDLEHESFPAVYGFQDQVPMNIFGGNCVVDFEKFLDRKQFLYEKGI